jgi:acyl-CoA thioester hydrolase
VPDTIGQLNQSVYHELLEEGRAALFAPLFDHGGWAFVLVRVEVDHHREVRRDHGHVDVVARVAAVGRKSVTVANEVLLPDGSVAAEGRAVLVPWDPQARDSRRISDSERAVLERRP